MARRVFDILLAAGALILFSPLFVFVAILIKLDSRGPLFFITKRCGQNRQPFDFYKFRTMIIDAQTVGSPILTTNKDTRVTRVGRFLRLFKIDELPQFLNVLQGEMSVVGPRPEVFEIVDRYYPDEWDRVLVVKPGLTCLLQNEVYPDFTFAHQGLADPFNYYIEHDLPYKLQRDLEYIERRSFWLDLTIIAQTLHCILFKSWPFLFRRIADEKVNPKNGNSLPTE